MKEREKKGIVKETERKRKREGEKERENEDREMERERENRENVYVKGEGYQIKQNREP